MLDVDSFNNIIEVVRTCVRAGRADLIEPALIDRQPASAVMARIEAERRSARVPASATGSTDALAVAVERRFRAYRTGGEVNADAAAAPGSAPTK
jgi:hypothetical protein